VMNWIHAASSGAGNMSVIDSASYKAVEPTHWIHIEAELVRDTGRRSTAESPQRRIEPCVAQTEAATETTPHQGTPSPHQDASTRGQRSGHLRWSVPLLPRESDI
jgi:hypothetical protein